MEKLGAALTLLVIGFLLWRYLLPHFSRSHAVLVGVRNTMALHQKLQKLLPSDTLHATWGKLYLSDEVEAAMEGTVLSSDSYAPMEALLLLTEKKFLVLDGEGGSLLSVAADVVALGLPRGYGELTREEKYFFFLIGDGYVLVAQEQVAVGEPLGVATYRPSEGDKELAYWDALLGSTG